MEEGVLEFAQGQRGDAGVVVLPVYFQVDEALLAEGDEDELDAVVGVFDPEEVFLLAPVLDGAEEEGRDGEFGVLHVPDVFFLVLADVFVELVEDGVVLLFDFAFVFPEFFVGEFEFAFEGGSHDDVVDVEVDDLDGVDEGVYFGVGIFRTSLHFSGAHSINRLIIDLS